MAAVVAPSTGLTATPSSWYQKTRAKLAFGSFCLKVKHTETLRYMPSCLWLFGLSIFQLFWQYHVHRLNLCEGFDHWLHTCTHMEGDYMISLASLYHVVEEPELDLDSWVWPIINYVVPMRYSGSEYLLMQNFFTYLRVKADNQARPFL